MIPPIGPPIESDHSAYTCFPKTHILAIVIKLILYKMVSVIREKMSLPVVNYLKLPEGRSLFGGT